MTEAAPESAHESAHESAPEPAHEPAYATDRFAPGARVRTVHHDPPHHTRLPRYARGKHGTVVEPEGRSPLADVRSQGREDAPFEQVYAVRFEARDLWGDGDHHVVLDLFESYLEDDQP